MLDTSLLNELAIQLSMKVNKGSKPMAIFLDEGDFRIGPTDTEWVQEVLDSFPDSIVGVYTAIAHTALKEDLEWFCHQMGASSF